MPSIAFTALTFAPGDYDGLVIQATPQTSPGRSFARRSDFRDIAVYGPEEELPLDFTPFYVAKMGALVSGRMIFIRVYTVNIKGIRSAVLETRCIVT